MVNKILLKIFWSGDHGAFSIPSVPNTRRYRSISDAGPSAFE